MRRDIPERIVRHGAPRRVVTIRPSRAAELGYRGGLVLAALAALAAPLPALAQETPTRSVVATASAGVDYLETRRPTGTEHDLVLQASPGLFVSSRSGRVRGSGTYSMSLLRRAGDGSSEVRNNLNAAFTAEAVPGWMFVDVTADIGQSTLTPFGEQSVAGSTRNDPNRTEVGTLTLTPRVAGRVGSIANYDARFSASTTNTRHSKTGDSSHTDTALGLRSAGGATLLAWGLNATRQTTSFRVGRSTTTERAYASLIVMPLPDLRFTARGGAERNNVLSEESERTNTWGVDGEWRPSERTLVSAGMDRRYFGRSHNVTISYRMPRSSLLITSVQDASTSADARNTGRPITLLMMYLMQAPQGADPQQWEQLVRALMLARGENPDQVVAYGFVTGAVTLQRSTNAAWTYSGRRITVAVMGFATRSRQLDKVSTQSVDGIEQRGYNGTVSYRLTPTLSSSVTGTRTMTLGNATQADVDLKSISWALTEQLGRRTTGTLAARYSVFDSPTDPYREASVTASVNMRF